MSYTTLRVTNEGVVLFEHHLRRLAAAGDVVRDRFLLFAKHAYPGIYSVRAIGTELFVEWREESRLRDGMPVRYAVSPFTGQIGPFPKPPPPSPYDRVRAPGVATLLTDAAGREVLESCSAAVVSWRGEGLLLVPDEAPRVDSSAERALAAGLPGARGSIRVDDDGPIALVNAVKGICTLETPGRAPFPHAVRGAIEELLRSTTRRS